MIGAVVWDAAWPDEALGAACVDLRAGMVGSARDVLACTRQERDLQRRALASLVLAAVAAGSNVAQVWQQEEPSCPDAWLLYARVAVVRALASFDRDGDPFAPLIDHAVWACGTAARVWRDDPTPWVALLALARTGRRPPSYPRVDQAVAVRGIPGPWEVWEREVVRRAPGHREAGHRLLAYFSPRYGGGNEQHALVAGWLSGQVGPGHPWRLLPVVAALEYDPGQEHVGDGVDAWVASSERARRIRDMLDALDPQPPALLAEEVAHRRERLEAALKAEIEPEPSLARQQRIQLAVEETYRAWFLASPDGSPLIPAGVPITDLSLLAWGLYTTGQRERAGRVLRHMTPYASRYPWSRLGDPAEVLDQVYRECLGMACLPGGSV